MSDMSILGIARTGMQSGLNGLKKNAINIASREAMQAQSPLVNDIVEMKMHKYQVIASGKIVETFDEMLGSLLDEKA